MGNLVCNRDAFPKEKERTNVIVFKSFEPSTHKYEQKLIFDTVTLKHLPFYQVEVGVHM